MREAKTWVFGDTHGAYKALIQVFERAGIQEGDTIISLGDICDGWSQVYECVELLVSMQYKYNMIFIKGNHDEWFNTFIQTGINPVNWAQGGIGTLMSYCRNLDKEYVHTDKNYLSTLLESDIPESHRNFFHRQLKWYKDENLNLFIHGGFNRHYPLSEHHDQHVFWWDRDLWYAALSYGNMQQHDVTKLGSFKIKEPVNRIYIGHTATTSWKTNKPMEAANITNLDTGAGFKGKLTIMDVATRKYFQSDPVEHLYDEKGRNG